jgi:nicotinamidase-related amidase
MPVDSLDAQTALVVVDLQKATTKYARAIEMGPVVSNIVGLVGAFRDAERPVILATADLNNPPGGRTQYGGARPLIDEADLALVDELVPSGTDLRIHRGGWSVFAGTLLDQTLKSCGVTQVVIVGLATNFGVESSVRAAYDLGYNVVVCSDAVNGPTLEGHQQSLNGLLPALAQIATTDEVRSQLR